MARNNQGIARADAEALLYLEARLLDTLQLDEWLTLFTDEGVYWIPIDETQPRTKSASIVYDDALGRQERVHHLLHLPFAAQNPRSRTVHVIGNVEVESKGSGSATVRSNQVIYETRLGDFTQRGLGQLSTVVASVEHQLKLTDSGLKISLKKILLINREMPQGNLTYML